MKIAIIGGGWVGCHLAYKLKDNHLVTLFEKNQQLFLETSSKNQNRLHLGYHYVRNYNTRRMCLETYSRFREDYPTLTKEVVSNIYCIPKNKSIVDFKTFCKIFEKVTESQIPEELKNIEGCVQTEERYIDFEKSTRFFSENLRDIIIHKSITLQDLNHLQQEFDLVVNATNLNLVSLSSPVDSFFENTITLIYRKIKKTSFEALTLVDGPFFSIYPYKSNLYTVTHVQHTPIVRYTGKQPTQKYDVPGKVSTFEKDILEFFPDFKEYFEFDSYFTSTKVKPYSESDSRYPVIKVNGNLLEVFTGKIQGIYPIEDYINNLLLNL